MRTIEEAAELFAYHPATPETARQHAAVRDAYGRFLAEVFDLIPPGPERTLAVRDLHRSMQQASLAIALQDPVDTSETRSVARVLPTAETAAGSSSA